MARVEKYRSASYRLVQELTSIPKIIVPQITIKNDKRGKFEQKRKICAHVFEMIRTQTNVDTIITGDESWYFTRNPKTKRWTGRREFTETEEIAVSKIKGEYNVGRFFIWILSEGIVYRPPRACSSGNYS